MISDDLVARVTQGHTLTTDTVEECDVCVIGSGCGGATVAMILAEKGKRVVVVEQGSAWSRKDFDQREANMLAKIDGARGLDTSRDGSANFTYGNNLGGASVHYWADSYRTPPDRLRAWALPGHSADDLAPHFAQIERDLNVHTVDDAGGYENAINLKVKDAAHALGWRVEKVPQARKGCIRSGHCMQGCAYDAKQSQLVTHLPRAAIAGARIYTEVRALRFTTTGAALTGTARELECRVVSRVDGSVLGAPTGRRLTVRANAFVIAAGGYATAELLLRQPGLKERLPHLGEHFFCNPCAQAYAFFAEDIVWWRNIPAAWGVEQFRVATVRGGAGVGDGRRGEYVEGGYLLMPNQIQPATLAACLLVAPHRQREIMARLPKLGGTIAWIDDADDGRVFLDGGVDGRRRVHVPIDGENGKRLRDAQRKQCALLVAAGAQEIFFGDVHDTRIAITGVDGRSRPAADVARDIDAAVAAWDLRPARNLFAAPHPGGGARMAADASAGVVGFDHRVHGTDNVFVADPSVFPSPPSVDPSLSIMAFSYVAANHIDDST